MVSQTGVLHQLWRHRSLFEACGIKTWVERIGGRAYLRTRRGGVVSTFEIKGEASSAKFVHDALIEALEWARRTAPRPPRGMFPLEPAVVSFSAIRREVARRWPGAEIFQTTADDSSVHGPAVTFQVRFRDRVHPLDVSKIEAEIGAIIRSAFAQTPGYDELAVNVGIRHG